MVGAKPVFNVLIFGLSLSLLFPVSVLAEGPIWSANCGPSGIHLLCNRFVVECLGDTFPVPVFTFPAKGRSYVLFADAQGNLRDESVGPLDAEIICRWSTRDGVVKYLPNKSGSEMPPSSLLEPLPGMRLDKRAYIYRMDGRRLSEVDSLTGADIEAPQEASSLKVSNDGSLAALLAKRTAYLIDLDSSSVFALLECEGGMPCPTGPIMFTEGRRLIVCDSRQYAGQNVTTSIRIWDVKSSGAELVTAFDTEVGDLGASFLGVSPGGNVIVVGRSHSSYGCCRTQVINANDGTALATLDGVPKPFEGM